MPEPSSFVESIAFAAAEYFIYEDPLNSWFGAATPLARLLPITNRRALPILQSNWRRTEFRVEGESP